MLTTLLLALTLAAPTQDAASAQGAGAPGPEKPRIAVLGPTHAKWMARKTLPKQLTDLGGFPLYEALGNGLGFVENQVVGEEQGIRGEAGRDVGATALTAIVLLGGGTSVRTGRSRLQLRSCVIALRGWQDPESGAIGRKDAPEFQLDHTLATLALCEAYLFDAYPVQEEASRKALEALLALRAEDGLWHVAGAADAAVDPLVTALAGLTLFAAYEDAHEPPVEALEAVQDWTEEVAARAGEAGDAEPSVQAARELAGALAARIFTAAALGRSLAGDETLERLSTAVAGLIPQSPGPESAQPGGPQPPPFPALLRDGEFLLFATLGLYQCDSLAWGRASRWMARRLLADQVSEEGERKGALPGNETGRLPGGLLGSTALGVLALMNGSREIPLGIRVE